MKQKFKTLCGIALPVLLAVVIGSILLSCDGDDRLRHHHIFTPGDTVTTIEIDTLVTSEPCTTDTVYIDRIVYVSTPTAVNVAVDAKWGHARVYVDGRLVGAAPVSFTVLSDISIRLE